MESALELLAGLSAPPARHAAIVHLPVALAVVGLPFVGLLCASRGRSTTWRPCVVGLYLCLVAGALAALQTGAAAQAAIGDVEIAARRLVEEHERCATLVWRLGLATAAAALATGLPRVRPVATVLCALLALATAGLVALVAHHGGTAVYRYGVGILGEPRTASAEAGQDPRPTRFANQVYPVLHASCMGCHGPGEFASGGLDLTSARGLLEGGTRGRAVVPGDPDGSLLIQAVSGTHATLRMPLGGAPLSREEIEQLRRWVAEGAVWVHPGGVAE